MIAFLVTRSYTSGEKDHFIAFANGREDAKIQAARVLLGNPDKYIVTPLTAPDETVVIGIQVATKVPSWV